MRAAAGAILYAWLLARGGRERIRAPRRELARAAAVGPVILGDIGLLALAEQEVPAGLAALLVAPSTPTNGAIEERLGSCR
jgi:hypothetical protein